MAESVGLFVLVIDDDEVMRELLTALLESEGHRVVTAESGEAGLTAIGAEAAQANVVLTDLRMPDTDAPAMLGRLRGAMPPAMRLIGMSGSDAEPEELALLDGFLLKPFAVEDFIAVAERARAGSPQAPLSLSSTPTRDAAVLDRATYDRMAEMLPPKAMRELYALTLSDVHSRTDAIRTAAAAGDSPTTKAEAHAMKGGCGMVGAMELRAIAADIEAGAPVDTSVLDEIDSAAERLRRMLDTLT